MYTDIIDVWSYKTSLDFDSLDKPEAVIGGASFKKGILNNIVKFSEKHLCQSHFFNKVAC